MLMYGSVIVIVASRDRRPPQTSAIFLDVSVGWKDMTLGNHYLVETLRNSSLFHSAKLHVNKVNRIRRASWATYIQCQDQTMSFGCLLGGAIGSGDRLEVRRRNIIDKVRIGDRLRGK
jgi:hypothetical protein